jgi:hypothetical protein
MTHPVHFVRLFAALTLAPAPVFAQIYVSPQGSDGAAGTESHPVRTLAAAVARARSERVASPDRDQRIILRGGTYRLRAPLVLGLKDSPSPGHTLTFAAAPGEQPLISGGEPVRNWRALTPEETPADLPPAARGHIWIADLADTKTGTWRFHALYDGFKLLPRARSPQYLSRQPHVGLMQRLQSRDVLPFPPGSIKRWSNLPDVEILARPNHDWVVDYLGLESLDEAAGIAHLNLQATYTVSGKFWVENILAALDGPGKWVLNTREGRLYLWAAGGSPGDAIVAPRIETLIRVEGEPDTQGNADRPAHGFRFEGLTFAHTDRDQWLTTDVSIQHDWEMWDKDDACLRFRVASDCAVTGCTFRSAGDNGIRADLFAQGLKIRSNLFYDLGAGGVLLCGYGPGTKDVNHGNEIVDNEFYRLGTLMWHSPAIFLWQSGSNLVAHNYIHDLPYNGIVLDGVRPRYFGVPTPKIPEPTFPPDLREDMHTMRWLEIGWARTIEDTLAFAHTRNNRIEENEVCDVMKVLKDGNGIYLSAAGKGNLLRRNVLYRMNGSPGIRTDDDQSYVSITQNVTIGGGIVIKDYNFTWNNILVDAPLTIISDRPDSRVELNVFVVRGPKPRFYAYDLVNGYFGNQRNDPMLANYNPHFKKIVPPKTDRNFFAVGDPAVATAFLRSMREKWGNDRSSRSGDAQFLDAVHGDFRFQTGSPAAALGIESVDTTQVGLLREPMRARLIRAGGALLPP